MLAGREIGGARARAAGESSIDGSEHQQMYMMNLAQ